MCYFIICLSSFLLKGLIGPTGLAGPAGGLGTRVKNEIAIVNCLSYFLFEVICRRQRSDHSVETR